MSELALVSAEAFRSAPRQRHPFRQERDLYPWCTTAVGSAVFAEFHAYGLRAALCLVRLTTGESLVVSDDGHDPATQGRVLRITPGLPAEALSIRRALDAVALVSDFEWQDAPTAIRVWVRPAENEVSYA